MCDCGLNGHLPLFAGEAFCSLSVALRSAVSAKSHKAYFSFATVCLEPRQFAVLSVHIA
jgi:hypothetical protein